MPRDNKPEQSPNPPASDEPKTPPSKQPSAPGQGIQPGETKTINAPGVQSDPSRGNTTTTTTTTVPPTTTTP